MTTDIPTFTHADVFGDDNLIAELQAELDAYRAGFNQPTRDPMHAGQPVHETLSYDDAEPSYYLQITHRGMTLWSCGVCQQVTLGEPTGCGKCGTDHVDDLSPLLYEEPAGCKSWYPASGPVYDGLCLIAGSDGCECPEEAA